MKACIACGMPMNESSDFAMNDESKDYCKHCCRPDGSMQSYQEKLDGLIKLIMTQGPKEEIARSIAIAAMAKLPAWKGQNLEK